jgi:hypothetical protein
MNIRSLFSASMLILCFAIVSFSQTIALPDLDLANCACKDGKLVFTIINHGPGNLPLGWQAVADIYFNGAKKGFISLLTPTSTTGGGIEKPNGASTFLTAFDITSPMTVDFVIDSTNSIKESNEANNTRKGYKMKPCIALPDLAIEYVGLRREGCYVVVKVNNLGPGPVPVEAWTVHAPDSPGVYLYVNGKAWGGGSIWAFDPARALMPAGGSATYVSKLSLMGKIADVKAVVDKTGKIAEGNEANNTFFNDRMGCTP